jgi:hypothetical protein
MWIGPRLFYPLRPDQGRTLGLVALSQEGLRDEVDQDRPVIRYAAAILEVVATGRYETLIVRFHLLD